MRIISGVEVLTTLEELVEPGRTAVIVVDVQNGIVSRVSSNEAAYAQARADVANVIDIIPRIQRLLAAARGMGLPIVFAELIQRNALGVPLVKGPTRYHHRDSASVREIVEGTWEAQTVDELTPEPGDFIIHKSWSSAMYHTRLDDILKTRNIRSLLLTGLITGGCVLMTGVDALHHGYYPVVVKDCVSSYDPERHELALRWMEAHFPLFGSDEVIGVWHGAADATGRGRSAGSGQ